ncbi:MAG: hypothetical protein JXB04_05260 [Kiritimatiellae bacterium]|nr:hypothetical protein [Kiritimatiellia bacterium]
MTEEQAAPAPEAAPKPELTPEVEEGKTFAILSYALNFIGLPFFLVPLIMRNNEFSLYHAKQNLILWLLGIVGSVVSSILAVVCIGIVLGLALLVFMLVLNIMGLMNAIKGEAKPLPLIGKWGEDWFKGLKKV